MNTVQNLKPRRGFYDMAQVLSPGVLGDVVVEHKDVQPSAYGMLHGTNTRPGTYAGLKIKGHLWMSDTDDERDSNIEAARKAKGDVLIAGLGLGMVLLPILLNRGVSSVKVIEKHQDVVLLVRPQIDRFVGRASSKLQVVVGDIHKWRPAKKVRQFDTIYFDIWPNICVDDLKDMKQLHATFRPYLRQGGWIGSWQYDHLRELNREGRWR